MRTCCFWSFWIKLYGEREPVQLGTLIIDQLVMTMTVEELQQAGATWNQAHLSAITSKRNTVESLNIRKYNLEWVKGRVHMTREVVIPLFVTSVVKEVAKLMIHSKCMNVVVKPIMGYLDHIAMARCYDILRHRVGKINVCLRNHSAKQITLPKWTAV